MKTEDFKKENNISGGDIKIVTAVDNIATLSYEDEVHIHYDFVEIYHFLDGDLYFSFEGKQIPVEKGSIIIIDCGTLHRPIIKSNARYERKRILINKNVFHRVDTKDYNLYPIIHKRKILLLSPEITISKGIVNLFDEIENCACNDTPYNNFCILINIFSLLLKAIKFAKTDFFHKKKAKMTKLPKFSNI